MIAYTLALFAQVEIGGSLLKDLVSFGASGIVLVALWMCFNFMIMFIKERNISAMETVDTLKDLKSTLDRLASYLERHP